MFASSELAAQIDAAEGRLCADIVRAAAPGTRSLITPIAGGLAIYGGPGSPINKAIGLAITEPLDESALAAVEDQWRERAEPVRIELSSLAMPEAAAVLTGRGYQLVGFENQLGCELATWTAPGADSPDIAVDNLSDADDQLWRDVTIDGFAHPDGSAAAHDPFPRDLLDAMFADLARATGFRCQLARIGGQPAGAASMRIDGDIAQLAGAATLPGFRRRGVQTALLRHRLREARAAGCALAVVTTQPGSTSQANSQRRGFALLYTRAILVKSW